VAFSEIIGHSECFREKSTKTRIETRWADKYVAVRERVLEKNPPKQGLKLVSDSLLYSAISCFREKSTKTRIETQSAFCEK